MVSARSNLEKAVADKAIRLADIRDEMKPWGDRLKTMSGKDMKTNLPKLSALYDKEKSATDDLLATARALKKSNIGGKT